jgi:hypothetical protein
VFLEEVSGLPPRRDIDFSIELAPGAVSVSRTPYRMSTPKLVELKLHLKEMMDKDYICSECVSMGSISLVCEEERWQTLTVHRL